MREIFSQIFTIFVNFLINDQNFNLVLQGSTTPNFITARQRVGITGQAVARFVDALYEAGLADFSRIHIVGHSLGS